MWNPEALRARFLDGLCAAIKDEVAILDLPRDLEKVINLCLRVETRLTAHRHRRFSPSSWRAPAVPSVGSPPTPPAEEPWADLGSPPTRSSIGCCRVFVFTAEHRVTRLSVKSAHPPVEQKVTPTPRTLLPFRLNFKGGSHTGKALIDSGAVGNFLDAATARRWRIPTLPLTQPKPVWTLAGLPFASITHVTPHIVSREERWEDYFP
ncbi:Retrotransposable element Tf2 type 1 [Labeo rohita]|uniref:Retrotransposable element Tf2 type 1 n=1 Tax=Labeo rohita TaxID=84645 RepID=A0A498L3U1_LABRO|nr:Retrotransposable element Tf2 type 1 [Labeo rohita]RXN32221.1 Retrotransposable element Tf2 type 1 [Labeo rohita]